MLIESLLLRVMDRELNVHVLKLKRCPHEMQQLLDSKGEYLSFCREDLRVHGYTHRLHCEAVRIYVHAENYPAVSEAVRTMNLERWHIVACDYYKEKLESAAKSLPSRLQVKLKTLHSFKVELYTLYQCWAM